MDRKLTHLQMIQGVINRLSTNSFILKGWTVVVVSALLAFGANESQNNMVYLAILPALVFWGLDGYFLAQERRYRGVYDAVRTLEPEAIDFSMDTREHATVKRNRWPVAVVSPTLLAFHGTLLMAIAGAAALVLARGG